MSDPKLSTRAEEAAQVLEDMSVEYEMNTPTLAQWNAKALRREAEMLRAEGL